MAPVGVGAITPNGSSIQWDTIYSLTPTSKDPCTTVVLLYMSHLSTPKRVVRPLTMVAIVAGVLFGTQ